MFRLATHTIWKRTINYNKLETYKDFSGIRNEEDFVITADGYKLLGKQKPKTIEDVEKQKNLGV
jgi:Xaa-Pro aminopeptidase